MVKDIKDLKALIKLCRSTGVEAIEVDGCKMNLGPTPVIYKADKAPKATKTAVQDDSFSQQGLPEAHIVTDELTYEQKLFYSTSDDVNPADQQ